MYRDMRPKYLTNVRPHLYQIGEWVREGKSKKYIATMLEVSLTTFNKYIKEHEELREIFTENKTELIENIKSTGYEMALNGNARMIEYVLTHEGGQMSAKEERQLDIHERKVKLDEEKLEMLKDGSMPLQVNRVIEDIEPEE